MISSNGYDIPLDGKAGENCVWELEGAGGEEKLGGTFYPRFGHTTGEKRNKDWPDLESQSFNH
jgi:hypothetical protein